jgi:quinol monooxygenase YgiN
MPFEVQPMPVLITAEVRGQTAQGYDGMLATLTVHLKQAPGLVLHSTHATEDGWRVIEVWESKAQSDQFFATFVAPHLPPGIRPKRAVQPLHNVVLPAGPGIVGPA